MDVYKVYDHTKHADDRSRSVKDEQKYKNEQALAEADLKVKELELNIFRKSLAETRRTLEDARFAAYQYQWTLHQTAAQYAVQLRVVQVDTGLIVSGNLI